MGANTGKTFEGNSLAKLQALLDVLLNNPVDGQVLTFVGVDGKWENKPASSGVSRFQDLTDVNLTGLANKDNIRYNSVSAKFENFKRPDLYLISALYDDNGNPPSFNVAFNTDMKPYIFDANQTNHGWLVGGNDVRLPFDCYLIDMYVYVSANASNIACQVYNVVGGTSNPAGSPSVSFGAGATGLFSDESSAYAVNANTTLHFEFFRSNGTGAVSIMYIILGLARR